MSRKLILALGLVLALIAWKILDRPPIEGSRGAPEVVKNLRALAVAVHDYHGSDGPLPPAALRGKDGSPLLSCRVLLLPLLGQEALYKRFNLDEPWDSPHNHELLREMPAVYALPGRRRAAGFTSLQVFVGRGTAFEEGKPLRLHRDFPDGISNTLLIVQAREPVPWSKPKDLRYDPDQPLPELGGPDGFYFVYADGRVRKAGRDASEEVVRAAITRNGGEALFLD